MPMTRSRMIKAAQPMISLATRPLKMVGLNKAALEAALAALAILDRSATFLKNFLEAVARAVAAPVVNAAAIYAPTSQSH